MILLIAPTHLLYAFLCVAVTVAFFYGAIFGYVGDEEIGIRYAHGEADLLQILIDVVEGARGAHYPSFQIGERVMREEGGEHAAGALERIVADVLRHLPLVGPL